MLFFSRRRRHTRFKCDWSSDVCASDHNASANAGGTVDYRYYPSLTACQADATAFTGTTPIGGTDVGSVNVTSGNVPASASASFPNAGTFYWAAFYSGDPNNTAAASDCTTELLVVQVATPSITTALTANPIPVGGSTTDTATLHNASANAGVARAYRYYPSPTASQAHATAFTRTTPTGGTDVGSVNVTSGNVPASASASFPNAGTFYWAAFYSGDPFFF